ncbi:alpha-tocopherol transfer protein-like [Halyomorpha halys]|uniref:alpha-tocopherol transfer protein-like n=1 Tax=Halyomorpha halys TaxID=286706 RepID=UPI0006D513FE|nr:alpha-tocopherol transfer protein-like [Halyomorpha halys]
MENMKTARMGQHVLEFEDSTDVGDFFVEKARVELRETPELRESALLEMRKLIEGLENFNMPWEDDMYLLPFLRPCKFYPQSALKQLLHWCNFIEKNPKLCKNLRPSEEGNVFKNNIFTVLPYRSQHGRRILLIEAGKKWNTKQVSINEIIRGIQIIVLSSLREPKTQIAGADIILDVDGLSLSHVWQFSPSLAKTILEWVQECMPCRLKSVHIVNQPFIFNMLFNIFKPFIGEKLRNRIHFHGDNRTSLLEYIDPKVVPTQYGGELKMETCYGKELHELICKYEEDFERANKVGFIKKESASKKK